MNTWHDFKDWHLIGIHPCPDPSVPMQTRCWTQVTLSLASRASTMLTSSQTRIWKKQGWSWPVVNFANILHNAFMCTDTKSEKKDWHLDYLFTLLGFACIKAGHKHVGEIDPSCQIHQRLMCFCASWFMLADLIDAHCIFVRVCRTLQYKNSV